MQKLSISRFRVVVVLIMAFYFVMPCLSQVSKNSTEAYLGKIQVYRFAMDSLNYGGAEKLSAVGKEFLADLYSSRVGDNTYFRILIDGNSYAVVSNPYGTKVSSDNYYAAWILKGGKYVKSPTLGAYMT